MLRYSRLVWREILPVITTIDETSVILANLFLSHHDLVQCSRTTVVCYNNYKCNESRHNTNQF